MLDLSLQLLNEVDWTALELKVGALLGLVFRRKAEKVARRVRDGASTIRQRKASSKKSDGQQKALTGETQ